MASLWQNFFRSIDRVNYKDRLSLKPCLDANILSDVFINPFAKSGHTWFFRFLGFEANEYSFIHIKNKNIGSSIFPKWLFGRVQNVPHQQVNKTTQIKDSDKKTFTSINIETYPLLGLYE